MSERIPERQDVAAENKWSIGDIYASDAAWEADFAKAKEFPARIASYKGQLSTSAEKLLEYMKQDDELSVLLDSLVNYAQRKND